MVSETGKDRNREKPYSDRTHTQQQQRHTDTLSWCQTSGKNSRNRRENLTVIEHTRKQQQQQQCR